LKEIKGGLSPKGLTTRHRKKTGGERQGCPIIRGRVNKKINIPAKGVLLGRNTGKKGKRGIKRKIVTNRGGSKEIVTRGVQERKKSRRERKKKSISRVVGSNLSHNISGVLNRAAADLGGPPF